MKKIDLVIVLLIIIVSVITLKDLFRGQFYTSHDGIHQVVRLYNFDKALRDGQIPPRWAGSLMNGFGYPLFIFSYHMPWIIAEPFYFLGLSIFDSIKVTFVLTFAFSGIVMYMFQKDLFGRFPSLVGTLIYLFAPYRFSNIFVRAAVGDATTFVFAPITFWSMYKLREKFSWKWIASGSLGIAGLILSHAMVFLLFFLAFLLYFFFFLPLVKKKRGFILSTAAVVILGLGLSSYYLIPSFFEQNLTKFYEIMNNNPLGSTFLSLDKLIYSSWGYGTADAKEGAMSLQVGISQWLSVLSAFLIIIVSLFNRKVRNSSQKAFGEAIFYLSLFLISIILMLPVSSFFWQVLRNIAVVDFTWRILSITVFAASVLSGYVIYKMGRFTPLTAIFLVVLAFYANRNHLRINQPLDWPVSFYLDLERTTNSFDEYTPKWVRSEQVEKRKPKIEFSVNEVEFKINKNTSNQLEFTASAKEEGIVKINTIYYPGWEVFIDGVATKIIYKNSGFIEFPLKSGRYNILARFKDTRLRKISNLITIASLGIVLMGLKFKTRKI